MTAPEPQLTPRQLRVKDAADALGLLVEIEGPSGSTTSTVLRIRNLAHPSRGTVTVYSWPGQRTTGRHAASVQSGVYPFTVRNVSLRGAGIYVQLLADR